MRRGLKAARSGWGIWRRVRVIVVVRGRREICRFMFRCGVSCVAMVAGSC